MTIRMGFGPNVRSVALVLLLSWVALSCVRADSLKWDPRQKQLDADIESWDLPAALGKLSATTGWQIYVEPNTRQTVSVKFKHLPVSEGLKRLLGDLNFALLPRTNGPARLFIFRNSLQEATQLVADDAEAPASKRQGPIPNELIVTLRSGAKESVDALARRLGAKILGRADGLNTYRLQFADEAGAQAARDSLASDPDVAGTDSNYRVEQPTRVDSLQSSSGAPFGLTPKLGNAGNQLIVGLIDTPVQTLPPKMNDFLLPAVHVAGDTSPQLDLTHGTSMAETLLQGLTFAPKESGGSSVRILPIDVYGSSPDTTTFDVAKGVYAAVAAGATVINLSLGGSGDSQFLDSLIHAAHQQGVLFFGAAGNQPTTDPTFPAAFPDVVAVTAGDRQGNIAPYANRGSFVDVMAPGVSLVDYAGQDYLVRGTSAATAYVSGTAAGYRANGGSPQNVEAYIRQTLAIKPAP